LFIKSLKIIKLEYWYRGERHRNWAPSIIELNGKEIVFEVWYHNGVKLTTIQTTETGSPIALPNGTYKIGESLTSTIRNFNGSIDEVAIFKDALTSAEVLTLYEQGYYEHGNYYPTITTDNWDSTYIYDTNGDGYGDYNTPYNGSFTAKMINASDYGPIGAIIDKIPMLVSVDNTAVEDPEYCINSTIENIYLTVTDEDGWEDINLTASYINITKGAITVQANECTNVSNTTTSVNISCTGAELEYWYDDGIYNITAYIIDNKLAQKTNNSNSLNYSTAYYANVSGNIIWTTQYPGTDDNENLIDWSIENCGNALWTVNLTGADVTSIDDIIASTNFQISNDSTPNEGDDLTISDSSQHYAGADNIPISTGSPSTKGFWWFLDMPLGVLPGSYTGTFTVTVSE